MNGQKIQFYFLLTILAATAILVFFIFRPFLYPLIFAAVFAVIFKPVYRKIESLLHGKRELAAFLTVLTVIIFVLAPFLILGTQIYQEVKQFYFSFYANNGGDMVSAAINGFIDEVHRLIPASRDFSINFNEYAGQSINLLFQNIGSIFSNLAILIFDSFIFLVSLYYLLIEGRRIKKFVVALSPLADTNDEMIFRKLETSVNSIVKGSLLVALVQGAMTAFGFYIFGISNPVLWGSVAAIAALVPSVGTALVTFPAVVFLFLSGNFPGAFGLMVWGAVAVGLIDNYLGPKFIGNGIQLHPLLILFSVIGGIAFFGPVGFLLGPLTFSLFSTLLDIYFLLTRKETV
jgi:predicted PurR-regulated permease PerM